MAVSEPMDPVDTTWLRMERPSNRMQIVGVLILAPPVDIARLEETVARRLLRFRRFRQRVEDGLNGPSWVDDPHFDIAHHIKRTRLPGKAGKSELEALVGELASRPLDPEHPLWQFHIVEDYDGGAAVIPRLHHAIADGVALIGVMLSLTDDAPDAPPEKHARPRLPGADTDLGLPFAAILDLAGRAVGTGARLSGQVARRLVDLLTHPGRAADYLRDGAGVAGELAYLLLMPDDTPTRLKGTPLGDKRVAWTDPMALPEVKAISRAFGCSVNDMLLAAVAGALNAYLKEKGDRTEGVEVRALVPINLRPPGSAVELGNRFGVLALELPVGFKSPLDRLFEVRRRMNELKKSYEPAVTLGLLAALGYAPKLVQERVFDLLLSRATAVLTNVPGPQHPLYLAGAEMTQVIFWVPQAHDIGIGISILSFNGQVQFGLIADAALVPDPQAIVARCKAEFEQLLYFLLLQPWGESPREPAGPARRRAARKPRGAAPARRPKKRGRARH
ncbi:MAG TPA: wax ester/triacylglycerol synthase family O-acyltransferase [Xanthobacteraceae bacterium]|nr:wax ester/triacylglycerol synthase family O-acyltransferase [Xanthobacteraceae bacterium]